MRSSISGNRCRSKARIIGFRVTVLMFAAFMSGGTATALADDAAGEMNRRATVFERAGRLLDEGRNETASDFTLKKLRARPGELEMAFLFIRSRARGCGIDSALAVLTELYGSEDDSPVILFASAERSLYERDFAEGSAAFGNVMSDPAITSDSLSLAVCFLERSKCLIGERKGEPAVASARKAGGIAAALKGFRRLEIEALTVQAEALNTADKLDEADTLLLSLAAEARESGFREAEASCLNSRARILEKRQMIEEAAILYSESYNIQRSLKNYKRTAAALNNLGQVLVRLGDLEAAEDRLNEARSLVEKCGDGWILAYIHYGLGSIEEAKGLREIALESFGKSFDYHEAYGNRWGALGAKLRMAYNLAEMGRYSESISYYTACADEYEKMGSLYGSSWALGGLAMASHKLGDLESAERYYLRTLEIRRKMGDRKGEAWCLNFLGMINNLRGDHAKALSHEFEAADIYREIGDYKGEGMVNFSIGSAYFYLGDYRKSKAYYDKAYAIASESGDNDLLQRVISGLGSLYSSIGREDEVENLYVEGLGHAEEAGNHSGILWATNNLASYYIRSKRMDEARKLLAGALELLGEEGSDHIRAETLFHMSEVETDSRKAAERAERALSLAENLGIQELAWKSASRLGDILLAAGDTSGARRNQEKAIEIVESIRRLAGADELKRHILEPAIQPYERMISILATRGEREPLTEEKALAALEYSERSRAQIFAGMMRRSFSSSSAGKDTSLVSRERELISELTFLQRKLQEEGLQLESRKRYLSRVEDVERRFERMRIESAESGQVYPSVIYHERVDSDELASVLYDNECALSYFMGEEESWLFFVSSSGVKIHPLPPRGSIEYKVGNFLSLLKQSVAGSESGERDDEAAELPPEIFESARKELFRILVGSALEDIRGYGTVIIIPDGILNYLPFQLLEDDEGFLFGRSSFFSVPSLRVLSYIRSRRERRDAVTAPPGASMLSVAVGGGGAAGGMREGRASPYGGVVLQPLPNASEEARAVAAIFEGSELLTGAEATEEAFKSYGLDRFDMIHIASHSYIDNDDVRRSFILFSREEAGTGEPEERPGSIEPDDGLLQWHEIMELKLNASLVTLSACESAGGVLSRGEGITGLTQAFIYAGADCVLASIIDIPDRFTDEIMVRFYNNIERGLTAAEALRRAQSEMAGRGSGQGSSQAWAAFILVGDGSVSP